MYTMFSFSAAAVTVQITKPILGQEWWAFPCVIYLFIFLNADWLRIETSICSIISIRLSTSIFALPQLSPRHSEACSENKCCAKGSAE